MGRLTAIVGSRPPAPFCTWLLQHGPAASTSLFVIDVGCRGGPPDWVRVWPGEIRGVGIDPDRVEIDRLRAEARWPGISWVPGWAGHPAGADGLPSGMDRATWRALNLGTWRRTSSAVAQRVLAEQVPPGDPGQQTEPPPMVSVDDLCVGSPRVDLLKVDTDGHDLEVLESAPATLDRALAVAVEVQLQGQAHPRASNFANIDRLLRSAGFELFDLRVHRHSRAGLPAPFWGRGGAPTHGGQTVWGDAVYFRDVIASPWRGLQDRGWMLAALFELAGLPDCAVELVQAGLVPGADERAVAALRRGWWRDGGTRALRWLSARPGMLRLGGDGHLWERLPRLPVAVLWHPWRA